MKRPRDPNMTEMLGAALLEIQRLKGDPIPREHAAMMSAKEIVSLFQCDHFPVRVETAQALGWPVEVINHPCNLDFKFTYDHRVKTSKEDIPEIAKGRKVIEANDAHRRAMLAKGGTDDVVPRETRKMTRKVMRKVTRKMKGRGFPKPKPGTKFNWKKGRYE